MKAEVEAQTWLDPADWSRYGRGRDWRFSLRTEDLLRCFATVAAKLSAEFELLACSRTQVGKESYSIYTPQRVDDLTLEEPWQYFVRNLSATPAIPAPEPLSGVGWPAVFAINGLVLLHHPDPGAHSNPPRSSIGVTHRAVNERTGEQREHREYAILFNALKRAIKTCQPTGT